MLLIIQLCLCYLGLSITYVLGILDTLDTIFLYNCSLLFTKNCCLSHYVDFMSLHKLCSLKQLAFIMSQFPGTAHLVSSPQGLM